MRRFTPVVPKVGAIVPCRERCYPPRLLARRSPYPLPVIGAPCLKAAGDLLVTRKFHEVAVQVLDVDPAVTSCANGDPGAHGTGLTVRGVDVSHTPEIVAHRHGLRPLALDFLEEEEAAHPWNIEARGALASVLASRGLNYEVWLRGDVLREPRRTNLAELRRHRLAPVTIAHGIGLRAGWASGHRSLGALGDAMGGGPQAWAALACLIARNRLHVDLDKPLGPETPVIKVEGDMP